MVSEGTSWSRLEFDEYKIIDRETAQTVDTFTMSTDAAPQNIQVNINARTMRPVRLLRRRVVRWDTRWKEVHGF